MNYNSKTITIKTPSVSSYYPALDKMTFSEKETQLRADALTAVFVSANPLRSRYNLMESDYRFIEEKREEVERLLGQIERRLVQGEKTDHTDRDISWEMDVGNEDIH